MPRDQRAAIRLPPGVRDFLPRASARRRSIAERLLAEFEAWGYARVITPMFERAEVLELGLGKDARRAAIRFVAPGSGDVVALRPDITPQVARIAATRTSDVDGPLRFCYEGAVTRIGNGARTQHEILQAGVELIGAGSPEGDAEVIALAAATLATMGIAHVRLDMGHVAPARFALREIDDAELRDEIELLLAKKARAQVAHAAAGLSPALRRIIEALPTLHGVPAEVLGRARALRWPAAVRRALDTVEAVLSLSRHVVEDALHSTITLDLGEVRGFEYYTGIRFAGYADGIGEAVLRGGRYDELVGRYGQPAQATGFAVDIEAIAQAQRASGIEPPLPIEGVLVVAPARARSQAMRIAAALRAHGLRAAVDLGTRRRRDALLAYAAETGFSRVLMLDPASRAGRGDGAGALVLDPGPPGIGPNTAQSNARGTGRPRNTRAPAAGRPVDGKTIERAVGGDARALITKLRAKRGRTQTRSS